MISLIPLVVPSAFSLFSPMPIFKYPCPLVGPLVARSDELSSPIQMGVIKGGMDW